MHSKMCPWNRVYRHPDEVNYGIRWIQDLEHLISIGDDGGSDGNSHVVR